ncbi:M48 family metallopeptidase [Amaricoccus solimangrovi]|uniref:M48 family metallopeptidase n=2 Tax=Amaricoccus solimangrovi TaxID=2589815 RepID=A0A501WM88_9RHOB|nr:M48 family metallopeptidase [Amaricoccus solimangrovi]
MILRVAGLASGGPVLTIPTAAPLAAARAFLDDHEDWLRRHMAARPRIAVRDGTRLPFGDGELAIRAASGGRRLIHAEGALHVPGRPADLPGRVAAFVREAAREACAAACDRHAAALGRSVRRITLRDPKGRWGSCTARGDLMFSWRLALAPRAVLDYVAAHEVAHLAEMNHSARFWAVVAGLCPDYAAPRDWLRREGVRLHGYDFSRPGPAEEAGHDSVPGAGSWRP